MLLPTFPERFNLADYFLFQRLREGRGSKVAIRFGEHAYTYDDVARRTRAFAAALEEADVRRGERVLIVLPDVPPFAWVFFGTLARGCVVAMANPDAPVEGIEYLVDYTQATAIVTVPRVANALRERMRSGAIGRDVRRVWCVPDVAAFTGTDDPTGSCDIGDGMFRCLARDPAAIDPTRAPVVTHRDEPAVWLFTSGSTGEAKANIHSHRDFAFNTEVYAKQTVGYAPGDVTVSVPRLYFGYATGTNLMFPFAVGATVGLFSERPTPESLERAIALYRPTVVTNVPTMLGKLLDHDEALRDAGKPGLDLRRCASRSPRGRPSRRRCSAAGSIASGATSTTGSAPPRCSTSTPEPPGRHQAGVARQGGGGLRAAHPARGGRRARGRRGSARRDRRPLGEGRQREPRLLARPRQELARLSRALVQDG